MKLLYASQGNVPSRWAHSFQAMKMAEAFGRITPDFALLTQIHWLRLLLPRFDFEAPARELEPVPVPIEVDER